MHSYVMPVGRCSGSDILDAALNHFVSPIKPLELQELGVPLHELFNEVQRFVEHAFFGQENCSEVILPIFRIKP